MARQRAIGDGADSKVNACSGTRCGLGDRRGRRSKLGWLKGLSRPVTHAWRGLREAVQHNVDDSELDDHDEAPDRRADPRNKPVDQGQ